ncbi:MAG: three-Cys-motif partner protein TcmP [Ignavibacteriae bacterium]|nr:three-Cys-motif partner protein TcmP [Ignavibacteriota bacterium]
MANNDFFIEPFDDGTKVKLAVFKEYLREWLPTFTKGNEVSWKEIYIYDFFAGGGKDSEGNYGSSSIIINELKNYYDAIIERKIKINVLFNDINSKRIDELREFVNSIEPNAPYNITYYNKDFRALFEDLYSEIILKKDTPRLMFIDQFGIKNVTNDLFIQLTYLKRTDFLFFISSSFVRRFSENNEFTKYLSINKETFIDSEPLHSHRIICNYYKNLIGNREYFIAPFSIKKGSNIYGLIFGSSHSLGIEKFLRVGWGINPTTGDANFNIDEELIADGIFSLFSDDNKPKKLKYFESILKEKIINKSLSTNKQIYYFAFDYECLPKHANVVIKQLIKDNVIRPIKMASQRIHKLKEEKIEIIS